MRAAVEPVRAKDDGGAQAYALLVLELADTVVTIVCGVFAILALSVLLCCVLVI